MGCLISSVICQQKQSLLVTNSIINFSSISLLIFEGGKHECLGTGETGQWFRVLPALLENKIWFTEPLSTLCTSQSLVIPVLKVQPLPLVSAGNHTHGHTQQINPFILRTLITT